MSDVDDAEIARLSADHQRGTNWKRWGPYLSERQWGTVREDYSPRGDAWTYFSHDQARSRAYRWGEDGLLGICDRQCRLCFALALHNGRDPILKERLFGLTGPQGNHGEDVKECYYYLDATPTSSYLEALYKYPQAEFPYQRLVDENGRRGKHEPELELEHTGVFDGGRYFDVYATYAKASADDVLVRVSIVNRGPEDADIALLGTLWFRNNWSWGRTGEGYGPKPDIRRDGQGVIATHEALGRLRLDARGADAWLFTDNETNTRRLFQVADGPKYAKDAFHDYVVRGDRSAVRDENGTKAAALFRRTVPAGGSVVLSLRLHPGDAARAWDGFDAVFTRRRAEADAFYAQRIPKGLAADERLVARQAYAGLLWGKQFYHYVVKEWLEGDPTQPAPPRERWSGRNSGWTHLYNRDVISMPDKWEYPWYAAWDLAFHMIPMARIDSDFAKDQLILFLREWYMHPNGALAAYEFALHDVNPPVHAWAAWRVYKLSAARGQRDITFLARTFQKLLLNFTWWVNRTDADGNNLFSGGFLGLDNIGVFDRSKRLPTGGELEQADGSAWMAFYCGTMLSMALELARHDPAYEDVASKFLEHYVAIADAMNSLGGSGLWDEEDGFYYDQLHLDGRSIPLKVRSMVGLIPLFACELISDDVLTRMPGFAKRMRWFLKYRPDLAGQISFMKDDAGDGTLMLAIPSRDRLIRVLRYVLDEKEFLSPFGVRALSRHHLDQPYVFRVGAEEHAVRYNPGDSDSYMFGGNSNWRGPVWFPVNWLLIEALEIYHHFYGDSLRVECPTGSGNLMNLAQIAAELAGRLTRLFVANGAGERACHGGAPLYRGEASRDLVLFYEYFHGDDGRGLGASHQTGWTALVASCLEVVAQRR